MSDGVLEQEFYFFVDHQNELVQRYEGRVVAIKGKEVLGDFDSYVDALETISETHTPGSFMLQKCEAGPGCYTMYYEGSVFEPVEAAA